MFIKIIVCISVITAAFGIGFMIYCQIDFELFKNKFDKRLKTIDEALDNEDLNYADKLIKKEKQTLDKKFRK